MQRKYKSIKPLYFFFFFLLLVDATFGASFVLGIFRINFISNM